jgi:hypothetical protein
MTVGFSQNIEACKDLAAKIGRNFGPNGVVMSQKGEMFSSTENKSSKAVCILMEVALIKICSKKTIQNFVDLKELASKKLKFFISNRSDPTSRFSLALLIIYYCKSINELIRFLWRIYSPQLYICIFSRLPINNVKFSMTEAKRS